jgi:hypothetical protein
MRLKAFAGFHVPEGGEGRCELGLVRLRPWDTLPKDSQDWLIDRPPQRNNTRLSGGILGGGI